MTPTNAEIVRAFQPPPDADLTELFFRSDETGLQEAADQIAALFADDFVCVFHAISSEERPGLDGFRSAWLDWLEPWETYRAEIDEVVEEGDTVVVTTRDYARRPGMNHEVELHGTAVYTLRHGKFVRAEYFTRREQARPRPAET